MPAPSGSNAVDAGSLGTLRKPLPSVSAKPSPVMTAVNRWRAASVAAAWLASSV